MTLWIGISVMMIVGGVMFLLYSMAHTAHLSEHLSNALYYLGAAMTFAGILLLVTATKWLCAC